MALPYVCDGDQGALLEWLHYYLIPYIVICTVVTISNWWFSSKDIKLRVLIKEALVVFHWLTLCIILLCSLASGHRALFLVQKTTQIYIYIIYNIIHNISNNHIFIIHNGICKFPFPRIVRVSLSNPWSGDNQGQKTFLAFSAEKQTLNYDPESSDHHPSQST